MIEVAAFITTMSFFASADTSAAASAFGVRTKPAEDVHLVAHHQLLRQALGDVGRDAAGVPADELELPARDGVALLLHVELDGGVHLGRRVGELAGVRHDEPDLDGRLRVDRDDGEQDGGEAAESDQDPPHRCPPWG